MAYLLGQLLLNRLSIVFGKDNVEDLNKLQFVINEDNAPALGFRGNDFGKHLDMASRGQELTVVVRITGR